MRHLRLVCWCKVSHVMDPKGTIHFLFWSSTNNKVPLFKNIYPDTPMIPSFPRCVPVPMGCCFLHLQMVIVMARWMFVRNKICIINCHFYKVIALFLTESEKRSKESIILPVGQGGHDQTIAKKMWAINMIKFVMSPA